jgi:hypothetical protein
LRRGCRSQWHQRGPRHGPLRIDALSLLANIVMAWNTAQMQQVLDHWAQRRGGVVPPELIGRIAPTQTEGINLRGVFRFPVERYADKILPSATAVKTPAGAS